MTCKYENSSKLYQNLNKLINKLKIKMENYKWAYLVKYSVYNLACIYCIHDTCHMKNK